jgi:hypothetical protein
MNFTLPGLPTVVSKKVELPNIAELLFYPIFQNATPETIRKYGTDFQKKLLDMTPIVGKRKYVNILSRVNVIYPNTRAMSTHTPGPRRTEWHIDQECGDFIDPPETVHLLISECSSMTQFNTHPIEFEIPPSIRTQEFIKFFEDNIEYFPVEPTTVEAGRIYTFSNHLHRAVDPATIEFRYSWRVHETDDPRYVAGGDDGLQTFGNSFDIALGRLHPTVKREDGWLSLKIPEISKLANRPDY